MRIFFDLFPHPLFIFFALIKFSKNLSSSFVQLFWCYILFWCAPWTFIFCFLFCLSLFPQEAKELPPPRFIRDAPPELKI